MNPFDDVDANAWASGALHDEESIATHERPWLVRMGKAVSLHCMAQGAIAPCESRDDEEFAFLTWSGARIYLVGSALVSHARPRDIDVVVVLPQERFERRFGRPRDELAEPLFSVRKNVLFDAWYFTVRKLETIFSYAVRERTIDLDIVDERHWARYDAHPALLLAAGDEKNNPPQQWPGVESEGSRSPLDDPAGAPGFNGPARSETEANLYRAVLARNARLAALVDRAPGFNELLMKVAIAADNFCTHRKIAPEKLRLDPTTLTKEGQVIISLRVA